MRLYIKGKQVPIIPGRIMEILYNHNWPGNVRELQSVLQRYLAVGNFDFLTMNDKSKKMETQINEEIGDDVVNLYSAIEVFEKRFILNALNQNQWRRGKVAAMLGIDPKTLYTKMKKIGFY
jgi:transcriptional regulator with PAS, ATPase and Fis domain